MNIIKRILIGMWMAICWLSSTAAHELPPVVVDVYIYSDQLVMDIPLPMAELITDMHAQLDPGADPADLADEYDRLRASNAADIQNAFEPYQDEFVQDFVILVDGVVQAREMIELSVPDVGDINLPRESRLKIRAMLPNGNAPVQIGWGTENGDLVVRQKTGSADYIGYLVEGELSAPIPRDDRSVEASALTRWLSFIDQGVRHIIPMGADHILFVLGLFFYILAWRPMLWQITTFTLAHSITLFMATLGWVSVPSFIVEPLIALSISIVAFENILTRQHAIHWPRICIVFIFGLLHGLGFASVLGDLGMKPGDLLLALIGFNIGVEFGQLLVIVIAFILVGWPFGQKQWYRQRIAIPASILIGVTGLWWFIERVAAFL